MTHPHRPNRPGPLREAPVHDRPGHVETPKRTRESVTGFAAAVLAAALAAPTTATASPIPPPPTEATVAAVKPAKHAAKRTWRSFTRAQRVEHCGYFTNARRDYRRGYLAGARLSGATPRRARSLWLGWRWLLARKCPAVLS